MAERNRYLRVDVVDPEGRPSAPIDACLVPASTVQSDETAASSESAIGSDPRGQTGETASPSEPAAGSGPTHKPGEPASPSEPAAGSGPIYKPGETASPSEPAAGSGPTFKTSEVVALPAGPATLALFRPTGYFPIDVQSTDPAHPTHVTLRAARLVVWLGDPGGRDLGGLPVVARSGPGEVRGRIGEPFGLWEGPWTIEVGDPVAGVAPRQLPVTVQAPETTLDLARLGSLVVRWGEGHGWPLRAVPLAAPRDATSATGPDIPAVPAATDPTGRTAVSDPSRTPAGALVQPGQPGRTGDPLMLWPGRYRIEIDGGPSREIDVRAGRLSELDLARVPTTTSQRVRQVPGLVRRALEETGAVLDQLGASRLAAVARRLEPAAPTTARGGDVRMGAASAGPSIQLMLRDARGYALTGWPFRLEPVASDAPMAGGRAGQSAPTAGGRAGQSAPVVEGRIGLSAPAVPGRYRLELAGIPGPVAELEVGAEGATLELPPLGALELILRDGTGASLRGARYGLRPVGPGEAVSTGVARYEAFGALGMALPLVAGRYEIEVPTTPSIRQIVEVRAGEVATVDLHALGKVDVRPGPDAPWGTPVVLFPDPVSADEPRTDYREIHGYVGQMLHLPPLEYRIWVGTREGEGERLELRAGRIRRPTVVGRGFDPLAPEDYNQ